jgi:MFS family permease
VRALAAQLEVKPEIIRSFGHDLGAVGTLSSIMQVVSAMAAVVGGVLADRYGRRGLFLLGQMLRCAAVATLFVARSFLGLAVLSIMRGMASVQSPAQSALTAEYTDEHNRATAIGLSLAAMYLATVIAPAVAGPLADRLGAKVPFVIALVLAALSWLLTIPLKERAPADRSPSAADLPGTAKELQTGEPGTSITATAPHPSHSLSSCLRRMFVGRRGLHAALVLASTGTDGILNGAFGVLLPLFIMDKFKAGFSQVALLSTFVSLGSVAVQVLGGKIADQIGRRRVILGTGVASLAVVALLPYAGSLLKIYLLLFLASTVANAAGPALSAVLVEVVGEEDRATFSGVATGVAAAGMGLGAWVAGIWYGAGFAVSWFGLIVGSSLASLVARHFGLPRDGKRAAERGELY